MAIKASSMLSIVDFSDINLQTYISANYPTTQIYDVNSGTYTPSWTSLTITPVVFVNDAAISITSSDLSISYKRQDGNGSELALTTGETVSGGKLIVSKDKLGESSTNIITYVCYITYTHPDSKVSINSRNTLTFSLVKQGANAHTVSIDGENIFKYGESGNLTGLTQISLTANVQGVSITTWKYKKSDGTWVDYPTTSDNSSITSNTLIVKPSHAVFFNDVATIKVETNDENCYDIITITKLRDGATGSSGVSPVNVIMSNEAEIFPANKDGAVTPAKTVKFQIKAYQGTTETKPTVTLPTAPSGMTLSQSTSGNVVTITMAVSNNASLGSNSTMSGTLDFTIVASGQTFTKTFSWAKTKTGETGASGEDAIVFETIQEAGNIIYNGQGTVPVTTVFYKGSTQLTSGVTYQWAKYSGGAWANISGATSSSYTIQPSDVTGATSFRCAATYNSKTYYAYCTAIDKTDPYSCELFSSVGLQLKNGEGVGAVYCRVWQNGEEVDSLKTTTFSTSAPSSPTVGDYYYKLDTANKTATLMKYSGRAWAAAPSADQPSFTYNWYCMDANGNSITAPSSWGTGKAVYIDSTIVDGKISIIVEVE